MFTEKIMHGAVGGERGGGEYKNGQFYHQVNCSFVDANENLKCEMKHNRPLSFMFFTNLLCPTPANPLSL